MRRASLCLSLIILSFSLLRSYFLEPYLLQSKPHHEIELLAPLLNGDAESAYATGQKRPLQTLIISDIETVPHLPLTVAEALLSARDRLAKRGRALAPSEDQKALFQSIKGIGPRIAEALADRIDVRK